MTRPTSGADIIAAKLKQAGCKYAFGIPGGEVLAILGGLDDVGIEFHLAKHENAAGFMAEGAWHAEQSGSRAPRYSCGHRRTRRFQRGECDCQCDAGSGCR